AAAIRIAALTVIARLAGHAGAVDLRAHGHAALVGASAVATHRAVVAGALRGQRAAVLIAAWRLPVAGAGGGRIGVRRAVALADAVADRPAQTAGVGIAARRRHAS